MIIVSGSTFAIICLVVLIIVLGGANAVGIGISNNMSTILIVLSILFVIRLVALSYAKFSRDSNLSVTRKTISVALHLAESALAVFTCYQILMYLVICSKEKGFFGFGIEMILWAIFMVLPFLGGTLASTVLSAKSSYIAVAVSSICYLISCLYSAL